MPTEEYQPGLHKLLTLYAPDNARLLDLEGFCSLTETLLKDHGLENVGSSSHIFPNGSFTAAYCLKESHICIHTWPEYQRLTLDVYLCNYQRDNSHKVQALIKAYQAWFAAEVLIETDVMR